MNVSELYWYNIWCLSQEMLPLLHKFCEPGSTYQTLQQKALNWDIPGKDNYMSDSVSQRPVRVLFKRPKSILILPIWKYFSLKTVKFKQKLLTEQFWPQNVRHIVIRKEKIFILFSVHLKKFLANWIWSTMMSFQLFFVCHLFTYLINTF